MLSSNKNRLNLIILYNSRAPPSSFSKSIALKYFDLPTNETCNLLVQYFQWTTSVLRVSITYRMKCNTIFTSSIPIFWNFLPFINLFVYQPTRIFFNCSVESRFTRLDFLNRVHHIRREYYSRKFLLSSSLFCNHNL